MKQKTAVLDMTEGNPVKLILAFAVPLFIGNIFQQVYAVVDTMVAGWCLGDSAIAAIGATGSLYGLIITLAWGLNSGFSVVITQSFGAKDESKLRKAIAGAFLIDFGLTAVLTAAALCVLRPLMRLMNTPESIFDEAYSYMIVICAGMLASIVYNMFAGIMRAFGNSKTPLYVLIFSSLCNIALDLAFVAWLGMGVGGAALATVLSQLISGVICGVYVFRHYRDLLPARGDFRIPSSLLLELLSTGSAMAFMYSIVNLGTAIYQGAVNRLGETVIAAHTAGNRVVGILMSPCGTIMDAAATFVGQNWGAKKVGRIRETIHKTMLMEIAWGGCATVFVLLFGRGIIHLMTGTASAEVLDLAVRTMRWSVPFFPILGVLLVLRTSMQAMGQKIEPVVSSGIELALKFLAAAWMIPAFGFTGVCVNVPLTWGLMTAYMIAVYLTKTVKRLNLAEKENRADGKEADDTAKDVNLVLKERKTA